jgi:mannose-6-phosphate isomerase
MTADAETIEAATASVARLTEWFRKVALPLWIGPGFDPAAGGFVEQLDFEAEPILAIPRRLTVQGRQIFTYARAIALGWSEGREKVEQAFQSMIDRYLSPDGKPGFVFTVARDGTVVDGSRDFYAHAFVLLAASAYYTLTGDSQAIALADRTLDFLDEHLRAPDGGYVDSWPSPPERLRQNPHMHLFEALLALHAATGKASYLARAGEIFGYFRTRFFRPEQAILAEFFDRHWAPLDGALALWEPGHHLEWSWLLSEYQSATGTPTGALADALIAKAYAGGIFDPCLIVEEIRGDGVVLKKGCRTWPLTEAVKAQAVRLEAGDPLAGRRLIAAADWMLDRHLSGCHPGLWFDQFTEDGRLVPSYVPASTLYHIAMAVFVGDAVMARVAAPDGARP